MKVFRAVFLGLGILFSIYLLLPGPELPPPDLPDSLKSTELGDTIQIPNVAAYFTDKTRAEVMEFYSRYSSKPSFLGITLPSYRLNYPPEYARQAIRDTIKTYYLEEIVQPLKASLFINGFEWESDVFTKPEHRPKNKVVIDNKVWRTKLTLHWFPSKIWVRLGVFWLAWITLWFVGKEWIGEIRKIKINRYG